MMTTYQVTVDKAKTVWWRNEKNQLHREDGPAVERANGYKVWYKNGKTHREDGPAVECADGYKAWYKNGKVHRENGPAMEYSDGQKCWYLNGKRLSKSEFLSRTKKTQCSINNQNYVQCGYRRAWIMWDLDNGHSWNKRDIGKGYLWVFKTRKEALAHKVKHKNANNAKLSKPIKIEYV